MNYWTVTRWTLAVIVIAVSHRADAGSGMIQQIKELFWEIYSIAMPVILFVWFLWAFR